MRWTDELVREFVKVATSGSYGDYDDCCTLNAKMKRFKELKRKDSNMNTDHEDKQKEESTDAHRTIMRSWDRQKDDNGDVYIREDEDYLDRD